MERSLRQRIGDRFQYYRHQIRGWKSPYRASVAIGDIDQKTIRDIEQGTGDPVWSSFENFAIGVEVPLERIIREALLPADSQKTGPEARYLLDLFEGLTDVKDRRYVIGSAERASLAAQQRAEVSPSSVEDIPGQAETSDDSYEPVQKSRKG